ncbi:MAG: emp24/gp25L/p24 family protein [Chloroflexi bacterium]|nr:emp24/gp25L/p24 family protein [Chloroflexota bacterium]
MPPGNTVLVEIAAQTSNRVVGQISIQGAPDEDLSFWITDPSNKTIVQAGRPRGRKDFAFTASANGNHTLHFSNSATIMLNKVVSYSYTLYWR